MHFFKKYPKFLKLTCLATISCGAGWLYYQVKTTRTILTNALDTSILNIVEPTIVEKPENENFVLINLSADHSGQNISFASTWKSLKFSFAKRLLILANNDNKYIRKKAVRQLARIKNLENWQCFQLSHMIDARTAVGLARTPDADPRLFPIPPLSYVGHSHEMIVDVLKDLLINLHTVSQHPCMGYFLSKAFVDIHDAEKYATDDFPSFELKAYIQASEELIPLCLESLLHHASVGNYAKDIAALNGLPLLMEIYSRCRDNLPVTATICRIISYLSMHSELLDELYISGWITILAQWVKHEDVRISIPAAKALANLDMDEKPLYLQRLYPLHPSTRLVKDAGVDVVFVHGLLGGVFFTWRQRKRTQNPVGFLGKKGPPESLMNDSECPASNVKNRRKIKSSDPDIQEFFEELEEHIHCNETCKDFEVIWEDIPTKTNEIASGPFCTPGMKYVCKNDDCFTSCWPKDWLAKDCEDLRVIGVNYETNLSMWTPICPVEKVKTLSERSEELIEQLAKVDVGKRPIVWVTHSMGGLIVKCLLNKASQSDKKEIRNICNNTKGVVFYSTPHVGSSVAKFSQASALVIWPSIEVQELQKHSPQLLEIHENFLELVKRHPMKVVTFVETQPTVVSAMKFKFLVVEPDSGNPGYGEYYEIPLDHLGICKPASRHSFLYQKVLQMIKDILRDRDPEM